MRTYSRFIFFIAITATFMMSAWEGRAFSLLGPIQPWMQLTNGVYNAGDIGGPMCISNGYRWNVPVVTYGFDQSFLKFFGTNGEAAVESAIQILNNLPPASQAALTNYPFSSIDENFTAQAQTLTDLKSQTLPMLLEHLGLTQPARYTFVLRQWNPIFIPPAPNEYSSQEEWPSWVYPDYISQLNYDPYTLLASPYVNDTLYTAEIQTFGDQNFISILFVDPYATPFNAVADDSLYAGDFYTGLTRDDVGGLSYLYSTNNIAYETLLPGVTGAGTNANSFVNGAWRPGVDKITFVPQPMNGQSGQFLPMTNYYTDTYITNGTLVQQQVARVIPQPDFLFCVGDVTYPEPTYPLYGRTGTTNWLNNAALNGNPGGGGPGVIQPQVKIIFDKIGPEYSSVGSVYGAQPAFQPLFWGSFDASTNPPVTYPISQIGTNQMTIRIWLSFGSQSLQKSFVWKPCSLSGTQYAVQTSTDFVNWTTLFMVTNNGSVCTYIADNPSGVSQYFRLSPQ